MRRQGCWAALGRKGSKDLVLVLIGVFNEALTSLNLAIPQTLRLLMCKEQDSAWRVKFCLIV